MQSRYDRGARCARRITNHLASPNARSPLAWNAGDGRLKRGIGARTFVAALGLSVACIARAAEADSGASPDASLETVEVVGERYKVRDALFPRTGSSLFVFDQQEISELPRGDSTPINQLMLQAPGVVQGDYGELHIRGEMTQPQYRINGTMVPEGISGFGQVFDSRFAQRIEFITGALPAQYNYRTNIIDIETKQRFDNGGKISLYGGGYGTLNPTVELSGTKDKFTYFLIGSYLQAENGILFPTAARDPVHDDTTQSKGFAYVSFLPDPRSRWSLMVGAAQSQFQIPNVPGQTPTFPLDGVSSFPDLPSAGLVENQRELNRYAVLSYEGTNGANLDYQAAFFTRYSSVLFTPDPIGDLIYRGIASRVERRNVANGVQFDASLERSETHTVRVGFSASRQRTDSDNNSQVFPADSDGNQIPGAPFTVVDSRTITANLGGVYAQDEWRASNRLTLSYGLRFDYLDGLTRNGQLSPRLSAVYKWDERTALHAGLRALFQSAQAGAYRTGYDFQVRQYHQSAGSTAVLSGAAGANSLLRCRVDASADTRPEPGPRRLRKVRAGPQRLRTVRTGLGVLTLQLDQRQNLRHRAHCPVPEGQSVNLLQRRHIPGASQGHIVGAIQLRPRRAGLHQRPLDLHGPRPAADFVGRCCLPVVGDPVPGRRLIRQRHAQHARGGHAQFRSPAGLRAGQRGGRAGVSDARAGQTRGPPQHRQPLRQGVRDS